MLVDEGFNVGGIGGFANVIGNVQGEEVTGSNETVDGAKVDVIGIEKVFAGPAEVGDCFVGSITGGLRLGADDFVLAVGLVPGWADVDAEFLAAMNAWS